VRLPVALLGTTAALWGTACTSRAQRVGECRSALYHLWDLQHPVRALDGEPAVGDDSSAYVRDWGAPCAEAYPRTWLACVVRADTEAAADACGVPAFMERQHLAWDIGDVCARWTGGRLSELDPMRSDTWAELARRADADDPGAWRRIAELMDASDAGSCTDAVVVEARARAARP
jgi:hypothetical protein